MREKAEAAAPPTRGSDIFQEPQAAWKATANSGGSNVLEKLSPGTGAITVEKPESSWLAAELGNS